LGHLQRFCCNAALIALATTVAIAQSPAVDLSVESGANRQTLARLVSGEWTAVVDGGCTSDAASERLVIRSTGIESAKSAPSVETPQRIISSGNDWQDIAAVITRVVEQREREHRLTTANLATATMTIDWVYAATGRGGAGRTLYFEASRRVPDPGTAPPEDPKGTLRVAVSGWLRADAGGRLSPVGSKSELMWEQEDAVETTPARPDLMPLGVIHGGAEPVWVMKLQIGRISRFLLYELGASGIRKLVETDAAIC
jgi:hypothetical protein